MLPRRASISNRNWLFLSVWSALVAAVLFFAFPNPKPLVPQNHQLKLIASGEKNRFSSGSIVEVRQIRGLDGKNISLDQFRRVGDWEFTADELLSPRGGSESIAEMTGIFPGGVAISLRYLTDGGKITIQWDDQEKAIDLYTSSSSTIEDFVFEGFSWSQLSLLQTSLILISYVGYFLGLFVVVFFFSFMIRSGVLRPRIVQILLVFAYTVLLVVFIQEKFSYYEFSGTRPYRDSRSYVQTADFSINSLEFWAGERPFTFPLALKLLDVHFTDNWSTPAMERVRLFQIWLSIGCWGLLAFLGSLRVRQNWLKPFAFGCILFFSLGLEIGIWDHLMMSESLSLSFFALLVAGWIGWQLLAERKVGRWIQGLYLLILVIVSILYSFARDSNLYFLLIAGALFLLKTILKRKDDSQKRAGLIYFAIVLLIMVFQNYSISVSSRWQLYVYDNLSYRILKNESAINFFAAHGLPITDSLMSIVRLEGFQYQDMLRNDPRMLPVKQWIDESGRMTYFLYLLNDLGSSLMEPVRQIPSLLDGSTLGYDFPIYPSKPYSKQMVEISNAFYFRSPLLEWLAGGLLLGASLVWVFKLKANSGWFVVLILAVSIYPLMFIVWHADPMEITRHAIQIGIQFRLAAWMALILTIDAVTIGIFSTKTISSSLKKEKPNVEV